MVHRVQVKRIPLTSSHHRLSRALLQLHFGLHISFTSSPLLRPVDSTSDWTVVTAVPRSVYLQKLLGTMFDNMDMLLGIRLASLALGLGGVFLASHMMLNVSILHSHLPLLYPSLSSTVSPPPSIAQQTPYHTCA